VGADQGDPFGRDERGPRGQALEEQAGQRVDVGPVVGRGRAEPLGGHVVQRTDGRAGSGQAGAVDRAGDPEVDQVDEVRGVLGAGAQHVGRFDVAVHQAVRVRGVQRRGDLGDHVHGRRRVERAARQHRAQVGALDQPHVDEQLATDLAVAVDRDDVRLAEPGGHLGLVAEPRGVVRVAGQARQQQLERDHPVLGGVVGPVDLAHAAAAEQGLDPVRAEHPLVHRAPRTVMGVVSGGSGGRRRRRPGPGCRRSARRRRNPAR
jgi:hypothetical protein